MAKTAMIAYAFVRADESYRCLRDESRRYGLRECCDVGAVPESSVGAVREQPYQDKHYPNQALLLTDSPKYICVYHKARFHPGLYVRNNSVARIRFPDVWRIKLICLADTVLNAPINRPNGFRFIEGALREPPPTTVIIYTNNSMYMVWYNNKLVQFNIFILFFQPLPRIIDNFSRVVQRSSFHSLSPSKIPVVIHAYRNKIISVCAIIIVFKPGKFTVLHLFYLR